MKRVLVFPLAFAAIVFFIISAFTFSQSGSGSVDFDARVPGCGDAVIDMGEDCDTGNLNGESCITQGFSSGSLSCTASCVFNTSACSTSGGGGGGGSSKSNKAQVVFSGRAYPNSIVTILKDAQIIATTVSDDDARFQINVSGLSSGSYIFSLYSEDNKGLRSSMRTFPVYLTRGILAKIESIFIAPTLSTDKSEVRKGDPIILFGQTTPTSEVTVEINSNEQIFVKTNADKTGVYLHMFNTAPLEYGQHHAQSRAAYAASISPQSIAAGFVVGDKNVEALDTTSCPAKADLNDDCRVNLVDFSIAAFWYNRTLSETFAFREAEKLNGDRKVNITDFSIMAFYWTG